MEFRGCLGGFPAAAVRGRRLKSAAADYGEIMLDDFDPPDCFEAPWDMEEPPCDFDMEGESFDDDLDYGNEPYEPMDEYEPQFADPGGNSALFAATEDNPRDRACPSCGRENILTRQDVLRGYQCDYCADADEGKYG